MTTKAEPRKIETKKVAILVVLAVVAALVLYFNVFAGDSSPAPAIRVSPAPTPDLNDARPKHREIAHNNNGEFKPRQGAARPEDRPDPASIDPTLRLDLLAKVQSVEPAQAIRNVFQYGAAPPPPKPIELPKNVPQIAINRPPLVPPPPPGPPPAPTAPPMTFKYYGYKVSKMNGRKQAFLLDGDDIIIAGENDPVKGARYKVVRIGVNSITIEDTQFKSTQTLPMQEESIG